MYPHVIYFARYLNYQLGGSLSFSFFPPTNIHTHTHGHELKNIYIYIYIYMCVYVCVFVCVCLYVCVCELPPKEIRVYVF